MAISDLTLSAPRDILPMDRDAMERALDEAPVGSYTLYGNHQRPVGELFVKTGPTQWTIYWLVSGENGVNAQCNVLEAAMVATLALQTEGHRHIPASWLWLFGNDWTEGLAQRFAQQRAGNADA